MESKTQTVLPLRVIARRHDEAIQATSTCLDCFVPRSDAKRRVFCCMWVLCLMLLFVACAPKGKTDVKETTQGDNLMRFAHNVIVSERDYGYLMEVICPWDTTLSLGKFAIVKDTTAAVDRDVAGVLQVPVKSVISFSATQWAVFLRLGEIDRVKGILEGRFVTDTTMRSLLAQQ